MESITMAERVRDLSAGMHKNVLAVLSKINSDSVSSELSALLRQQSIDVAGVIPYDPSVFEACLKGRAIVDGKASRAAKRIIDGLLPRTAG